MECLQTGIYRNDIPLKFRLEPEALQVSESARGQGLFCSTCLAVAPTCWDACDARMLCISTGTCGTSTLACRPRHPSECNHQFLALDQGLLDRLDETLTYALEKECGVARSSVTNYDEIREQIAAPLRDLRDRPNRIQEPLIYHLDVGAMYPNIILTNRLQPPAIVTAEDCANCEHNRPESNCKRPLEWMWRGEVGCSSSAACVPQVASHLA